LQLLVASYSAVRRAIWPYSLIGKSRREEVQVEKEEDSTAEPMDIEPDHPQQQQQQQQHYQHSYRHQPYQQQYQPDVVDSLVNGLHQIAF